MDTQYMEILERLKTRHLLTSSAVDSLARISAFLEKAQELGEAGLDYGGHMHRIIGAVRPDYVIIENSPQLRKRGLEYVLHGLSEIGYDAQWHGNVQATYIRGKNGGMKLVSMGDGLENVSSKIQNVWKH